LKSPRIVLASTSAYRRALLERLRLPFEIRSPQVDEAPLPGESARATALRLAEAKARAVAPSCPAALIIGSDQVAALGDRHLGKPGSHEKAVAQLKAMRGKEVVFHTALALVNSETGAAQTAEIPTAVAFRSYSDAEIEHYLAAEQPYDCAGSAKIEGLGIILVEYVRGDDPTALIGLPLARLASMLRHEGVAVV
jgi:septum formation protein